MTTTWKKTLATVGIAVAGLSLAACSAQPGVALSVGDQVFTVSDLQQGVDEYAALTGDPVSIPGLAHSLPEFVQAAAIAEAAGVEVTDADVAELLASLPGAVEHPELLQEQGKVLSYIARYAIAQNRLQELASDPEKANEILEALNAMDLDLTSEVNPRFGTVNRDARSLQSSVFGDVVRGSQVDGM